MSKWAVFSDEYQYYKVLGKQSVLVSRSKLDAKQRTDAIDAAERYLSKHGSHFKQFQLEFDNIAKGFTHLNHESLERFREDISEGHTFKATRFGLFWSLLVLPVTVTRRVRAALEKNSSVTRSKKLSSGSGQALES